MKAVATMRCVKMASKCVRSLTAVSALVACGGIEQADFNEEETEAVAEVAEALGNSELTFQVLSSVRTGAVPGPGAEIAAYDSLTQRVFSVNPTFGTVEVIDLADPHNPTVVASWSVPGVPNSVTTRAGVVAIAVGATPRTSPGQVQFRDALTGALLSQVTVGSNPDMLTFSPNGQLLLVANEGEPSDEYSIDPEGTVSIIRIACTASHVTQADVTTVALAADTPLVHADSIRKFGPNATLSQDIEPEYITVSHDSRKAWVTLQENNAVGVIDLPGARFEKIVGLGFKSWNEGNNRLDASDRDGPSNGPRLNIQPWPVYGMYQPDAIRSYRVKGRTYLITANEGDARAYPGFSEETRVRDLFTAGKISPTSPAYAFANSNAQLGRLRVTNALGDTDGDGLFDNLYAFGARSFSIWSADVDPVFDSGAALEEQTAALLPTAFNSTHDTPNSFDTRSDDKGPEPEGVAVQRLFGRDYAFVALERVGGVIVYDVTSPTAPVFAGYVNNRDFAQTDLNLAGDLGPEGIAIIPADQSPSGTPLLMLSNEISTTTTFFEIGH
jgi:hypothetical protein